MKIAVDFNGNFHLRTIEIEKVIEHRVLGSKFESQFFTPQSLPKPPLRPSSIAALLAREGDCFRVAVSHCFFFDVPTPTPSLTLPLGINRDVDEVSWPRGRGFRKVPSPSATELVVTVSITGRRRGNGRARFSGVLDIIYPCSAFRSSALRSPPPLPLNRAWTAVSAR